MINRTSVKTNATNTDELSQLLDYAQGSQSFANTVPNKIYMAYVEQNGAADSAPTSSVIFNSTGKTISYNYKAVGTYEVTGSGLFDTDSFVYASLQSPLSQSIEYNLVLAKSGSDTDYAELKCYDTGSVLVDGFFRGTVKIVKHQ